MPTRSSFRLRASLSACSRSSGRSSYRASCAAFIGILQAAARPSPPSRRPEWNPTWPRSIRSDKWRGRAPPSACQGRFRFESFFVPEMFTQIFVRAVAQHRHDHAGAAFGCQFLARPGAPRARCSRTRSPPADPPREPAAAPCDRSLPCPARCCRRPASRRKSPARWRSACASSLPGRESRWPAAPE